MRLLALALAALSSIACSQRREAASASQNQSSFRIVFGTTDQTPADWSGSLEVSGGRVAALSPWRFDSGDKLLAEGYAWQCTTRLSPHPSGARSFTGDAPRGLLMPAGLYVTVEAANEVRVKTKQGSFTFRPADVLYGEPVGALQGRALVERVPASTNFTAGTNSQDDYPSVAVDTNSDGWVVWVRYRNSSEELVVARAEGGSVDVLARGDFFRPQIIAGADGRMTVVTAVNSGGTWKIGVIKGRGSNWSPMEYVSEGGPDISPSVTIDSRGKLWVVWQGFRGGKMRILGRTFDGRSWQPEFAVSGNNRNAWDPSVASDRTGGVHVVWDAYEDGNYDIFYRKFDGQRFYGVRAITTSPRFEAHASVTCDRAGRVWIAWDEAGANWGKDTGFHIQGNRGEGLYESRDVRVVVLAESGMLAPPPMGRWLAARSKEFLEQPQLETDFNGNVWCLIRRRHIRHQAAGSAGQARLDSFWDYALYRYTGKPSQPIVIPFSHGRNDERAGIAAAPSGRLTIVWASDGRTFSHPHPFVKNDVYTADIPGVPYTEPVLQAWFGEKDTLAARLQRREEEDVRRLAAARVSNQGKPLRVLRGDLHRHSDLSPNGGSDGSLWDFYRYALDAAALDFGALTDNAAPESEEYLWWLGQKSASLFLLPGRFTTLFAYERTLADPPGTRNLYWAQPRVRLGASGEPKRSVFQQLASSGGFSLPHSMLTPPGTTWANHDPGSEPVAEIYQGGRESYEHEGAPRAPGSKDDGSQSGGYHPEGFLWNAWAKGVKIGVVASSGHASTHTAYAVVLSEHNDRASILSALRARHTYAATDNILLDFRCEPQIQGDSFSTQAKPQFSIRVEGTAPVEQIDLIKDNRYVFSVKPNKASAEVTYEDKEPGGKESYYYVRVVQKDGQLAWSSPIWINRR